MRRASRLGLGSLAALTLFSACSSGPHATTTGTSSNASATSAANGTSNGTSTSSGLGSGSTGSTGTGGANGASSGTSSGTGGAKAPTASTWMGTNVNADLSRVDVTYQLTPFDTPAAQQDANGYPLAGVAGTSSTDIGFVLPTGSYKISYEGGGTLTVSGIGTLAGGWTSSGVEQRSTLNITGTPGAFGNPLTLKIAATPGQTVTNIHIYMPGYDYDSPDVFIQPFLDLLTPFRALRFMEWQAINGSKLANWSDRPTASHFGKSPYGEPYEHIVALINQTGKDCWVNIPEHATDDFIQQFATFLAQNLDPTKISSARSAQGIQTGFQVIVENSNETWNQGFTAYQTFLTAANAMPSRYTGTYTGTYGPSWMTGNSDLVKVGQYEADRLAKIATTFQTSIDAHIADVSPVLSGWALGAGYSDVGLSFLQANGTDPKTVVSYVAMAPYFSPDDAQTGALDTLFTSANANVMSMDATFQDFAKLVKQYGVQMAAYEGGQGITGTTNQPIKHLAQHDQRMYDAYNAYFSLWKQDLGEALFMHFDLAGTPGLPENIYQYGYWGSIIGATEAPATCMPNLPTLTGTESIPSVVHHCPKYRSLAEHVPN